MATSLALSGNWQETKPVDKSSYCLHFEIHALVIYLVFNLSASFLVGGAVTTKSLILSFFVHKMGQQLPTSRGHCED